MALSVVQLDTYTNPTKRLLDRISYSLGFSPVCLPYLADLVNELVYYTRQPEHTLAYTCWLQLVGAWAARCTCLRLADWAMFRRQARYLTEQLAEPTERERAQVEKLLKGNLREAIAWALTKWNTDPSWFRTYHGLALARHLTKNKVTLRDSVGASLVSILRETYKENKESFKGAQEFERLYTGKPKVSKNLLN